MSEIFVTPPLPLLSLPLHPSLSHSNLSKKKKKKKKKKKEKSNAETTKHERYDISLSKERLGGEEGAVYS